MNEDSEFIKKIEAREATNSNDIKNIPSQSTNGFIELKHSDGIKALLNQKNTGITTHTFSKNENASESNDE